MAFHGILQGFARDDRWFGGVTCTNGAGSPRTGPYKDFSDERMAAVRGTGGSRNIFPAGCPAHRRSTFERPQGARIQLQC